MTEAQEGEIEQMRVLLRSRIQQHDFTQRRVQGLLGWGESYLSELLHGRKSLYVGQVLVVLETLGADAAAYYFELYRLPMAGEPVPVRRHDGDGRDGAALHAAAELGVGRQLALLKAKIGEQGGQVEIQDRLGWGSGTVSRLLRQKNKIRVGQLLLILAAIGVSSKDFYAELYRDRQDEELPLDLKQMSRLVRGLTRYLARREEVSEGEFLEMLEAAADGQ